MRKLLKLIFAPASPEDPCAVAWAFGAADDSSRFFPTLIVLVWRDRQGFNPGFLISTTQNGLPIDKHLSPQGWRVFSRHWRMFGERMSGRS